MVAPTTHSVLLVIQWSAWRKNLPRSPLTVSLLRLSDWSSMEWSVLSLPAMRQSLCWTNLFTCHECLENVQNIDESWSGSTNNEIVRDWILQLQLLVQYHSSLLLGRILAISFENRTWLVKFDSLIPIPPHSSLQIKLVFSQYLHLAHHLRKNMGEIAPETNPQ